MSEAPFQTRTVTVVALVTGASFLFALALAVFGPEFGPSGLQVGPTAYSKSALGHEGLVATLERLDVPVVVSRFDSARKARANGVLVIAEPTHGDAESPDGRRRLEALIEASDFTLLVLPKRRAFDRHPERPDWVGPTHLLSEVQVEEVLAQAGLDADVRRVTRTEAVTPILTRIGAVPTFEEGEPVQVVQGSAFLPLVTTNAGQTLLARVDTHPGLYVLADPDPLSNAGFHRGDNAYFFLRILNHVRDGYASVVFDETVHGFDASPTVWRELFAFPLVLVPIHLVLLLALALWAALGRFGTPPPAKPPLDPGLPFLVDRTAALLRFGGTSRHALPRYLDVALRDTRNALDAPPTLKDASLDAWLDGLAARRGARDRVEDLRRAVRATGGHHREVLDVAERIHRWKTEILHGAQ